MTRNAYTFLAALVVVLLAAGAIVLWTTGSGYRPVLIMPSAAQLPEGAPVWINGSPAGSIYKLQERDGKAVATLDLDVDQQLHEGTTSRVEWKSALGERILTLYPGPQSNAPIPDGGSFQGQSAQIEVDQVLATLDKPTRDRLAGLVQRARTTLGGSEQDLQQTLKTAGPTVEALSGVLEAVGSDGPALRGVVSQLSEMSRVAAERQARVRHVVGNLSTFTNQTAQHEEQIRDALKELPQTLDSAKSTLDEVDPTADEVVPLLKDLRPATQRLGPVARNLRPLLADLRPTIADLRPTLKSASELLDRTPGLLDSANDTLPKLEKTITGVNPAVTFLRPYMPEATGFLTGFGEAFNHFDTQGKFWAGLLAFGGNNLPENLFAPPGSITKDEIAPGEVVNQPFTDANGGSIR